MTAPRRDGGDSPFSDWIRHAPELDPVRASLSVTDTDLWIHQYATWSDGKRTRNVQNLMFVEIKTYNAPISEAQRDTLNVVDQLLRRRGKTPTRKQIGLHAEHGIRVSRAVSTMFRRKIFIRSFGGHLLTMSGSRPDESSEIYWSTAVASKPRRISLGNLIDLLRFELDPDTLLRMDLRPHHAAANPNQLILIKGAVA